MLSVFVCICLCLYPAAGVRAVQECGCCHELCYSEVLVMNNTVVSDNIVPVMRCCSAAIGQLMVPYFAVTNG